MKNFVFSLSIILLLNSCASIFNGKKTTVKISADKPAKIIFKNDTIAINNDMVSIHPERSKNPLEFQILKDSLTQNVSIKRKTSSLFWLNFNPITFGLPALIDLTNSKRFTYKRNLHFVSDTVSNSIMLSNKKTAFIPKNTLFLYTSPLQALDVFSTPMLTLGAEYFFEKNLSLSTEFGIKYTNFPTYDYNISYLKDKGFLYRLETKWYNAFNLTKNNRNNEYLGLELRILKNQFNNKINYYEIDNASNDFNFFTDDFATKRTTTIVNLKYGVLIPLGKKLYFDFYSGLGFRIKNYKYINFEYDANIHRIEYNDDVVLFKTRDFENYNSKTFFNYALGCKFGVKL